MRLLKLEPAIVLAFVQAMLTLLVVFGVKLTDAQQVAILTASGALLALLVRALVTPTAKLP